MHFDWGLGSGLSSCGCLGGIATPTVVGLQGDMMLTMILKGGVVHQEVEGIITMVDILFDMMR